ncbi:MAG TPA: DUF116 domain-containing protein [Polyangiaceae bacterium]
MNAPTYDLRGPEPHADCYLTAVGELADWVTSSGERLRQVIDAYGEFVELNAHEPRRGASEYLLEALMLGVLWRARGREATNPSETRQCLITELVRERRAGAPKRRDGSNAELIARTNQPRRGRIDPSLSEIDQLLNWLLATGEYDDEVERLSGWKLLLSTAQPATSREILRLVVAFAVNFEAKAERTLGAFTSGVDSFLTHELASRPAREDTLQCSRRRVEYHLSMVGAELLNRAWREQFLACRRHVVVLPGCARLRAERECRAHSEKGEFKCVHCNLGCSVSTATRLAERFGVEVVGVDHGSDFGRFLESQALLGQDVGIVGVACASGLVGAGWRAKSKGLPAQCVLLNASGCAHWRNEPAPTSFDQTELGRVLSRDLAAGASERTARVA